MSEPHENKPFSSKRLWHEWLRNESSKVNKNYINEPSYLVRDSNVETDTRHDYAGRELLELVQNAADAAANKGGNGRVHIKIDASAMYLSNTGQAFISSGVKSLRIDHLSNKQRSGGKKKLIGSKGLGFRSILNWTREPLISSGKLEIAFSRAYAELQVLALGDKQAEVKNAIEEYKINHNGLLPVPILSFPVFSEELKKQKIELLDEAAMIRLNGYDTVVVAKFISEAECNQAKEQAKVFDPRFLLFVEALSEITIEVIGSTHKQWKKIHHEESDTYQLEINTNGVVENEYWICRQKTGELPESLKEAQNATTHYEIGIGVRRGNPHEPGKLHCYFPTGIQVPLCALFHGTLDVTSNRNELIENSKQNHHVLANLGELYAETLAELHSKGTINGSTLDWLMQRAEFPVAVGALKEALYAKAAVLPLIPTVSGRHVCAKDTFMSPSSFNGTFPEWLFPGLALCRPTIKDRLLLKEMKVRELDASEVVKAALNSQLSLEERAEIIISFSSQHSPEYHLSALFIDNESSSLGECSIFFPPPDQGGFISMPSWVQAKFISDGLWKAIKEKLGQNTRDTVIRLKSMGIEEYSLIGVIELMMKQFESSISEMDESKLGQRRMDLLNALYKLFMAHDNNKNFQFPKRKVHVLTQNNSWMPAQEVHLSSGYGMSGAINELLYAGKPQLLMGVALDQGVTDKPENLALFFQWIGVNEWPRSVKLSNPDGYYWDVVKSALGDPVWANDQNGAAHAHSKPNLFLGYTAKLEVESIEELDSILSGASCEAILAWLSKDARFSENYKFGCALQVSTGRSGFRPVLHELPDLVRYRIQNKKWLKCSDGITRAPVSVIQEPPRRLSEVIPHPIDYRKELKEKYGLDKSDWDRGLSHASAPPTLNHIEQKFIYEMLSTLENKDSEQVRSFYKMLYDNYGLRECNESVVDDFIKNGRLQAKLEAKIIWLPPKEIVYIDIDGIPNQIRRNIPCLDLPSNFLNDRVFNIFRVQSLSSLDYARTTGDPTGASEKWETCISSMFEGSKRFIGAIVNDSDNCHSTNLESLKIIPVSGMKLTVTYNNNTLSAAMDAWTYCLDQNCLYIVVDEGHRPYDMRSVLADTISNGVSEYLNIIHTESVSALLVADNDYARIALLKRWLPNLTEPEIATLMTSSPEFPAIEPNPDTGLQTEVISQQRPTEPILADENQAHEMQTQSQEPQIYHAEVTDLPSPFVRDKTSIAHRVRETDANQDRTLSVAKGKRAEDIVMAYEEFVGRFPKYVGNQQGTSAYGCDIISFETSQELEDFLNNSDRSLVSRFIEVKSSVVTFTKNEKNSAMEYNDRFYVYQVKVKHSDVDLIIVCNPLSFESALDVMQVIDIGKIPESGRIHKRITLVPN